MRWLVRQSLDVRVFAIGLGNNDWYWITTAREYFLDVCEKGMPCVEKWCDVSGVFFRYETNLVSTRGTHLSRVPAVPVVRVADKVCRCTDMSIPIYQGGPSFIS